MRRFANPKSRIEGPKPAAPSGLATAPKLLDLLLDDLHAKGVVGEDRTLKLLYLILTSRLLPQPVSAVLKGPSSSGKSFLIERVLEYFPKSAYYALSSMSQHAMIYDREPLAHRTIILYEAKGSGGELATYLLRSILSEGRVRYVTTERGPDGVVTRTVEREGPTSLLTTTTDLVLHPENETRMLSIPVTDSPAQTAGILAAIAKGQTRSPVDTEWPSLQAWLKTAERRVAIPYAESLMALIPPIAVRLRRDVQALVSLIQSHAILHQASRKRDDQGRVLATLADYDEVRSLVKDLFAETAGAAVPVSVRQVVAAVDMHAFTSNTVATVQRIASILGIDKSTASRHVKKAIELGYLTSKGHRAARGVVKAARLPEQITLLPEPEQVALAVPDTTCQSMHSWSVPNPIQ